MAATTATLGVPWLTSRANVGPDKTAISMSCLRARVAWSKGVNIPHTVRTACEGTTEIKVVAAYAASAKSAVNVRRACNGTPGKYNVFSRSWAICWARRCVRAQSLTSYPLAARRLANAVPQEPAPMTATRVLWTCSDMSYTLCTHPVACLAGQGTLAPVLHRCLCSPGTGAAYRFLPATVETITMIHRHLWRIGTVQTPVRRNLVLAFPITHG